jgi:hypothetical protein
MKHFLDMVNGTAAEKKAAVSDFRIFWTLNEKDGERWIRVLPEDRREKVQMIRCYAGEAKIKKYGPEFEQIMATQFPDFKYRKVTKKVMKKAMKKR